MKQGLLVALVLVTAACGEYQFPGQPASSPSPALGAVKGRVIAVPCSPVESADSICAGRPMPGLEIDYVGASCAPCKAVTDAHGNYSTELPPADYNVKLKTYLRVISGPLKLSIAPGMTTTANYVVDSGIRVPAPPQQ